MTLKKQLIGQQITDSEAAQRMVRTFAAIEREQLSTAVEAAEAAGIDVQVALPDPDARADALLALSQAVVTDSFAEWYADELGREWYQAPPAEWIGAGVDSELWTDQIATWAEQVRTEYPDIDATDRELATIAAKEVYGVGLDAIESEAVGVDPAEEVNRLVTGNFAAARHLTEQVVARIDALDGDLPEPEEGTDGP